MRSLGLGPAARPEGRQRRHKESAVLRVLRVKFLEGIP